MRNRTFLLAVLVCTVLPAFAADVSPQAPAVVVQNHEGVNTIFVEAVTADGQGVRQLIRSTRAAVAAGETGWSPGLDAAFANWTENGQVWTAFSRNGGRTWTDGQAIGTQLKLRAGFAAPGKAMPEPPNGLALDAGSELYIVQFKSISLPEYRAALNDGGASIQAYFPENAHIVRMEPGVAGAIERLDFVERIEPYHTGYRLEPELHDWLAGPGPTEMRVRVMTFEWGPAGKQRVRTAAEASGARVAEYWPSGQILELWVDRDQLRGIAAHNDVMWIDRWSARETDMNLVREDAGTNWLEANPGYNGQDVRGEVLDNGIEDTHMDFDGILLHGPKDTASHGTNTYGIVFGNGDRDGDGDVNATGHMPTSQSQGIFADYGFLGDRFVHTQELKSPPYEASFQTNSWGNARTTAYTSVSAEMDDIIFRLDIVILQSQSNAGNQQSRPQAWAKNIIAVGGIRHQNTLDPADDNWSGGASIGPAEDGRIKPDLNYWYDNIRTTTTGNGYTSTFGGTSAATPECAGVLGLMAQMWSEDVWSTSPGGASVFDNLPAFSTLKALAVNNAKQYTFSGTGADLTRVHQGWGRPNTQIAHERAAESFIVDAGEDVLTVGQSSSYDVTVSGGQAELKVTMIYPDPSGTTSAAQHRINDVSLKVTAPDSTVYHGNNGLLAGNYSTSGGSPNTIDTVENVFVQNPQAGTWTVEVTAAEVNADGHLDTAGDDVVYSLVVTGASGDPGVCGNGIREAAEDCDGADLGGATCGSEGCTGGTLGCDANCNFDFTNCTGCPTCDNDGTCETFEDCNSCPNDCRTGTSSSCGNGICEIGDGEDCLSCPADCNGKQSGKPSNRYCCGDGAGETPVGCGDSRCDAGGNSCMTNAAPPSCCGDGTCEGDESTSNCEIDCGPSGGTCGDSICSSDEDQCSCPTDCGNPPSSEAGACSNGEDDDCDGQADCQDADCASDPACDCLPRNALCTADVECCGGKCRGNGQCN